MSATIRQVVDDCLRYIGEIPGAGVETFEEDRMKDEVIRGFNLLFKKDFWNQYLQWFRLELDGVLGIIKTDSLEMVLDFEDFRAVHRDTERNPMPIWPRSHNPYNTSIIGGSRALYWDSLNAGDANYAKRKLQFYPKSATGFVNVHARVYPLTTFATTWDWEDIMYFDKDLMVYAAAFMALSGDDLNSQASSVAQAMMDEKYKIIKGSLAGRPIPIQGVAGIPMDWYPRPY